MELYNLSPAAGSTKEAFRKGRGHGSGNGKTGGRGHKAASKEFCGAAEHRLIAQIQKFPAQKALRGELFIPLQTSGTPSAAPHPRAVFAHLPRQIPVIFVCIPYNSSASAR